ncbi:MAG: sigma-54 interaction domain-containing protein [Planctomycetota bacterium JB042]
MSVSAARLRLLDGPPSDAPRFVGRSASVRALLDEADRLARTDLPLLLTGESGTGKEVLARRIHAFGARAGRAFVAENVAAIPESLLEAELFGAVRGAYTGAERDRPGLFVRAEGGTLLLDEIGDLPLAAQAKLLRVLEEGRVRPVGASEERPVDVRIVCATHRDLPEMVRRGTFREDLYYRLRGATLRIPALRERPDDVTDLAASFLADLNRRHGTRKVFRRELLDVFRRHAWPGNARELRSEVTRLFHLSDTDVLDASDLALEPPDSSARTATGLVTAVRPMVEIEEAAMRLALEESAGHRDVAAKSLGISRAAFYAKLKRYGIEVRSSRARAAD